MFRQTTLRLLLLSLAVLLSLAAVGRADDAAAFVGGRNDEFFENKVRPLLSSNCFSCHGEKKQESDLRLDSRSSILLGGSSGSPAATPGDPDASLLWRYVMRQVDGMEMPPDDPLSEADTSILRQWITGGLFWPAEAHPVVQGNDERLRRDRAEHWSFQPILPVAMPAMHDEVWSRWPTTQLDRLVLDMLLRNGLTPSPAADRRTLIRRVYFDLLGLPPTSGEVDGFVADDRPDAYERLVDRLLSSPRYGERWGRYWLDVARYADTRGYAFNRDRNYPFAYTYRDYVIGALGEDLPMDEFILQQLAADQLPLGDDNRALAALGFLTVGRKFNNPHDDIDDKIDVVTRGLLGLTVACARCHDHKYDAIPTEDYYSLYGVFASSQEPSDLPLIGDATTLPVAIEYQRRFDLANGKLAEFDRRLREQLTEHARTRITDYLCAAMQAGSTTDQAALARGLRPALVKGWKQLLRKKAAADEPTLMPWFTLRDADGDEFTDKVAKLCQQLRSGSASFVNPFIREALLQDPPATRQQLAGIYGRVLTASYEVWQTAGGDRAAQRKQPTEQRQLLWYFSDPGSPAVIEQDKIEQYLTPGEQQDRDALKHCVEQVTTLAPSALHRAMVLRDNANPADARVFVRGDPSRPGQEVPRRAPLLLGATEERYQEGSGRLELAREIIDPANPLTARVLVNRVWMHHFGQPLVDTPSDFGVRAPEPLQRQLLDHLADRLRGGSWSLKRLHRELLLSATYRQASGDRTGCYAVDPENRLLWRMNRRRLDFESLRDALLATSGELDTRMGGKPERLFEQPEQGRRRSIYGYIDRQDLPNLLRVFDFASPDQSAEKRTSTSVPQQSLFLMNSPLLIRLARIIAADANVDHANADGANEDDANEDELVSELYLRTLARRPTADELNIARSLLDAPHLPGAELTAVEQLVQLLLMTNEFAFVD